VDESIRISGKSEIDLRAYRNDIREFHIIAEEFRLTAIDETVLSHIAFYDTDGDGAADYSAIIISTSGNRFTTIENNVTDNIRQATYTTNNTRIVGYGVPDYSVLLEKEEGSEEAK
jgi:hypothetical protein